MSQQNVDLVKALFAAFATRNLNAAAGVLDQAVEIRPGLVGALEGRVYRGLPGNEQFWTDIDAVWAEFRIETEDFRDLGDQVLVLGRAFAKGRESGVLLDQTAACIADLRDGKVVGFRSFTDQREALDAAGLRE